MEYYQAVTHTDISKVDGIMKNPERVKRLMRSYARHQGSQASLTTIAGDISTNEAERLSEKTISDYLTALKKIFVVEDAMAWNPNLRSKTAIRSSDTRYFVDPSIAVAALEMGPDDLIGDLNTMGLDYGEKSVNAKLTNGQAEEIRVRYSSGQASQNSLAKQYGVSRQTVSAIIRYKKYIR